MTGDQWIGIGLLVGGVALLLAATAPFVYQAWRRRRRSHPVEWWGKR